MSAAHFRVAFSPLDTPVGGWVDNSADAATVTCDFFGVRSKSYVASVALTLATAMRSNKPLVPLTDLEKDKWFPAVSCARKSTLVIRLVSCDFTASTLVVSILTFS